MSRGWEDDLLFKGKLWRNAYVKRWPFPPFSKKWFCWGRICMQKKSASIFKSMAWHSLTNIYIHLATTPSTYWKLLSFSKVPPDLFIVVVFLFLLDMENIILAKAFKVLCASLHSVSSFTCKRSPIRFLSPYVSFAYSRTSCKWYPFFVTCVRSSLVLAEQKCPYVDTAWFAYSLTHCWAFGLSPVFGC